MHTKPYFYCLLASLSLPVLAAEPPLPTSPYPAKPSGAHGKQDPHAKLSAEKHIQVALQHQLEGRPHEALNTLQQALGYYPNEAKIYGIRGSIYLAQQQPTKALQDFIIGLKIKPDDANMLTNRAQAYRAFGRINEALADLNQAIKLDKRLVAAYFNRGAIFYSSTDFKAALADFDQCVAIDPHAPAPYFNRASVHAALDQKKLALADLARFLELERNPKWRKTAEKLQQQWQVKKDDKKTEIKTKTEAGS